MNQLVTASANAQLDQMLEDACEGLQLTSTQLEQAEGHYRAVGDWLSVEGSALKPFSPKIRPQGSILQGTVVKPMGRDEFDIDLVCLLTANVPSTLTPGNLYELVANRLESSDQYKGNLRRDARCLTLEYAGDFCLDILPALLSDTPAPGSIMIPDRDLNEWVDSNPFGFAEWFRLGSLKRKIEKYAAVAADRKDVQPLPTEDIAVRPLQRAVQLIKRRRDVVYDGAKDPPSSILLTALAGIHYDGDWPTTDALVSILLGISRAIKKAPLRMLRVPNPSDPDEDLTAGWSLDQHREFAVFMTDFANKVDGLLRARGMEDIKRALEELFGETVAVNVLKRHGERLEADRQSGRLRIGKSPVILTGSAAAASRHSIARNTFFGA